VGPKNPIYMLKRVLGGAGTHGAGEPLSYLSAHYFGRRQGTSDANLVFHRIYGCGEVLKYMARLGFTPIGHMRVGISPTQTPKTILRNHKTPALLTGPEGGISGVNLVFHRTYGRGMVLTSMPCLGFNSIGRVRAGLCPNASPLF